MADKKKGGQESKKGKPRSAGKSKEQIARYYGQSGDKRLRRVFRHSGKAAAEKYAMRFGLTEMFTSLVNSVYGQAFLRARARRAVARIERRSQRRAEKRCSGISAAVQVA